MAMVQLNLDALQATISALKVAIRDMPDAAAGLRRRLDYVGLSAPGLSEWLPGGSVEAELRDILADLQHRFDMGVRLLDLCSTGMDGMSLPGPHMVWLDETLLDDQDAQTVADLIAKYGQGDDPLTEVPQDLLDLLAADSDDVEFGQHLATLLDPLDAAALLASLDSIRHPYGPGVGNGVSTPGFEARLDQLVTHLGQALGAGLQTLPPDQQQQVSDRWAAAFTSAPIAAPDLSLIISRGAWPAVFLSDVSDAIAGAEDDWASGLSHLASSGDPPETFWMHSGATPITDPGQRLANGDFIQILDPMYGVWMAARANPGWMVDRYGGGTVSLSYDQDDDHLGLPGEAPEAVWGLFDKRGLDTASLMAFAQAAASADMSASLVGDAGTLLPGVQVALGHLALQQREYEAQGPWAKYHHQILGALATVAGIGAIAASAGTATPGVALGLSALSVVAVGVDMVYNISEDNVAGAILDGVCLLPVAVGAIGTAVRAVKLIPFTRAQLAMLRVRLAVRTPAGWVAMDESGLLGVTGAGDAAPAANSLPVTVKPCSPDLADHIINVQRINKDGVSGGHNMNNFNQAFRKLGVNPMNAIITEKEIYPGVYQVTYRVPLQDSKGDLFHPIQWKLIPTPKTLYDPRVVSDAQYYQWGQEAMANASLVPNTTNKYIGVSSNGLKFEGILKNAEFDTIYAVA